MIDVPLSITIMLLLEKWETLNNLVFSNSNDNAKFEKHTLGGMETKKKFFQAKQTLGGMVTRQKFFWKKKKRRSCP